MYADYRDLNKANAKDDFLLLRMLFTILWINVEAIIRSKWLQKTNKITFVMLFSLKNVGSTHQCNIMTSCHDMMHQEIKVYVDGRIAKLREGENLVETLRKLFERLKEY